jgi:N-methylhydantoinase B
MLDKVTSYASPFPAARWTAPPLPSKVPHTQVKTGDRFVCIGPAGGGYGQSFARDPQRVLDDVLDGLISIATAQRDFGVVISADGTVDVGATAIARATR